MRVGVWGEGEGGGEGEGLTLLHLLLSPAACELDGEHVRLEDRLKCTAQRQPLLNVQLECI